MNLKIDESKIVSLYKSDISVKDICTVFGIKTPKTVQHILKAHNVLNPYFLSRYSYSFAQQVLCRNFFISQYNKCKTIVELKEVIGCGLDLLRTLIQYHKLPKINSQQRRRNNVGKINKADVTKMYIDGWSMSEIAKKYKSTSKTIKVILKKSNVKILSSNEQQLSKIALSVYNDYNKCLQLRNESKSLNNFSGTINCCTDTALKILKKHGIKTFTIAESKLNSYKDKIKNHMVGYEIFNLSTKPDVQIRHISCNTTFTLQKQSLYRHTFNPETICPSCNPRNKTSSGENDICSFLNGINVQYAQSCRDVIPPYELDIYIPELKIAIEYCGLYWHSEIFKDKNYHKMKYDLCKERGIRLITIFEDEWLHKKDIIKLKLAHILVKSTERTFARKCTIQNVEFKNAKIFLENNHIQGSDKAKIYYGLYDGDVLVALMSFKHLNISRGQHNKLNTIELSRYCTSKSVIGGFSRLIKHFSRNNPKYDTIMSYCDIRWGDGGNIRNIKL